MSGLPKMRRFKDFLEQELYLRKIENPSTEVTYLVHSLSLRFDSKDVVYQAAYLGPRNPWMASLCYLIEGKSLSELTQFNLDSWEKSFKDDQTFWDIYQEEKIQLVFWPLEILKSAIDVYRGREYLYKTTSSVVCRCFGVREKDILDHLHKEEVPSLDTLGESSNAGKGCRSCIPQLKRWLVFNKKENRERVYKEKPIADWVIEIDYLLSCFPSSQEWRMEIESFKLGVVIISFDKEISQSEEEKMGLELQRFLGAALDSDLSFFLRRARHLSNA